MTHRTLTTAEALTEIANCLASPNALDSNGEPANLVDTTDAIAHGLYEIAEAIRFHAAMLNTLHSYPEGAGL